MAQNALRDENRIPVMLFVGSDGGTYYVKGDEVTGRLYVDVPSGSGDVVGPASSVNENIAVFDGITGKLIKDGAKKISELQLALGYTAENVANKSTNVATDGSSDTKYPSVKAVKDYADGLVVGLWDDRGSYDASGNVYPSTGGSGTSGAILKGDIWTISVVGTLGGVAVNVGDTVRALVDTPGQTSTNWGMLENNIGYVPENVANKVNSFQATPDNSHYPSEKLTYDQLALKADLTTPTDSIYRQAIINGNFDVWQRGTSFTGDEYSADRWSYSRSGGTGVVTRENFTVGQTDVPSNPKYFLKLSASVGNDNHRITQKIEGVNNFAGQNVTVSFYAKGTNPSGGKLYIGYIQYFGVGGSTQVTNFNAGEITLTASWQKFTKTIAIPSITGTTIGENNYLSIEIGQGPDTATDAWELNLAQVQLNAGSVALPFQPKSYAEELRDCQRYYEKSYSSGIFAGEASILNAQTHIASGTSVYQVSSFKVTKRALPTIVVYSTDGTIDNVRNVGVGNVAVSTIEGIGDGGFITNFASSDQQRYYWQWTASAEL